VDAGFECDSKKQLSSDIIGLSPRFNGIRSDGLNALTCPFRRPGDPTRTRDSSGPCSGSALPWVHAAQDTNTGRRVVRSLKGCVTAAFTSKFTLFHLCPPPASGIDTRGGSDVAVETLGRRSVCC
jgi:hypothetical protein